MDSARFGKALGVGAREAAKALVSAADAASAEAPQRGSRSVAAPASAVPAASAPRTLRAVQTARGVREGSRRFGEAVWKPAAKLTSVLWLEVTGVFFSLFAIVGFGYCWSHRAALHGGSGHDQRGFWMMACMTLLFGYFCLSSFVRARRRSRR